jgi:hypothetical protein
MVLPDERVRELLTEPATSWEVRELAQEVIATRRSMSMIRRLVERPDYAAVMWSAAREIL